MDRMNPLDASFLAIEDDNNPMHIGNVSIFEGPAPTYGDVVRMVASKLPLVPRYRQKVRMVPLQLGRPVWVDDPHFQILYHIRHTAVPAPGSDDQLRNLAGRVFAQNLDRSKPLWEMWIVEGLRDGRWALISKVHHSMVDGVSGADLLQVLLDHSPAVETPVIEEWSPTREPSTLAVLADATVDRMVAPLDAVRGLPALARSPLPGGMSLGDVGRSLRAYSSMVFGKTVDLNGPIGPHRRWSWAKSSLADIKLIRQAIPGTVNDVVLAVITAGFRDLLLSRGLELEGRVVRTLVPVSVRSEAERGVHNNRVSGMFPGLPVGIDDPVERLEDIHLQMDGLKESKMAVAGDSLVQMGGFAPPMLLALGTRLASRMPQRTLNTVTTNVPGPQIPLYIQGRQMLEAYPYVPIQGNVRIAIAIFSYLGGMNFGVTGDYDTTADIDILTRGIEQSMQEYLRIAGGGRRSPAPRKADATAVAPRRKQAKSATPDSGSLMEIVTTVGPATTAAGNGQAASDGAAGKASANGASRQASANGASRKAGAKGAAKSAGGRNVSKKGARKGGSRSPSASRS
ncbi:MAG: wax ester/triacylglycerol synthase family O-acyltransferase [Candidatus Dormibacteraeota bacterium]|nr:wax ester/triacylglycerol synthase family O-acyltransferase [Candidatus Dormibacteraeota bacterium]